MSADNKYYVLRRPKTPPLLGFQASNFAQRLIKTGFSCAPGYLWGTLAVTTTFPKFGYTLLGSTFAGRNALYGSQRQRIFPY